MAPSNDALPAPAFYERPVWAWVLLALSLCTIVALGLMRDSIGVRTGDEPTFIAMTESLVRDHDLLFTSADRARLEQAPDINARVVILESTPAGIAYSKPVVYALFAAPWFALFGADGMLLANALAMGLALWLAWLWLRRRDSAERSVWALATWFGAGVVPAYLAWQMSDALQVALTLGGGVLALWPMRDGKEGWWTALVGGGLLGLVIMMRYPNAILVVGVLTALLVARRYRRTWVVALAVLALLASTVAITKGLTGAADPYTATRTSVGAKSELPAGRSAKQEFERQFEQAPASHYMGLRQRLDLRTSAYSLVYFWVGRHTGVLIYLPASLALLWVLLRSRQKVGWVLLAAAGLLAVFYLLWTPRNYFGGGTFLGNRYILTAYALLLLALPRLPRPRVWLVSWLIALVAGGSALDSQAVSGAPKGDSQGHAYAGIFRVLPYDSTGHVMGVGTRDRYWASDFVRFVDPYSTLKQDQFELSSKSPAAGIEIATAYRTRSIQLLVRSEAPEADLVVSDWLHSRTLHLGPRADGIKELIDVPVSPAWRFHRFWWTSSRGVNYHVRLTRWKVVSEGPAPVVLRLRYLGLGQLLRVFSARLESPPVLPSEVAASSTSELRLRITNTSHAVWWRSGVAPVRVGYKLESSSHPGEIALSGRQELPSDVRAGLTVPVTIQVRWPSRPGDYRLVVDCLVEHVAWFEDKTGEPLFAGNIRVVPAAAGGE